MSRRITIIIIIIIAYTMTYTTEYSSELKRVCACVCYTYFRWHGIRFHIIVYTLHHGRGTYR